MPETRPSSAEPVWATEKEGMLGAAETDLWDEAVLRTAARAFRAWRHAVAQAHEPRRSSAATVLGSERYRQLGLRRRSWRSLRGSQSEERPPDEPAATTTSEQREIPEELEQPLPVSALGDGGSPGAIRTSAGV